jgi:hypothetical protein
MHHFTLGSCIEWSAELGRSWCCLCLSQILSWRSLAVTEWVGEGGGRRASPAEVLGEPVRAPGGAPAAES